MNQRQQSTTTYPIPILMISSSNHISGVIGLSPSCWISQNGSAFVTASGAITETGSGWYSYAGNSNDRSALGELIIHVAASAGADPFDAHYTIVPWNPFDGVRLGLTSLPNATALDVGGIPSACGVWTNYATRIVTGGSVVATSGSVVTTSNLDKANYSLSTSGLGEISSSVTTASGVWTYADRIITGGSVVATSGSVVAISVLDKADYVLAASSIGASTLAASAISNGVFDLTAASQVWNAAVRTITGGSVVATSGSVVATSVLDKSNYSLSTSGLNEIAALSIGISASDVWNYVTRTLTDLTGFSLSASANDAIKAIIETDGGKLDHLWETTENDAGVRRFTTNALEQAPGGTAPTVTDIDTQLSTTHGSGLWGNAAGAGTGTYTDTVTDDGSTPLDGVRAYLTTDAIGENMAYEAYTNALGVFTMHPDPGTYYRWFEKSGYSFTDENGDAVVIT